MRENGNWGQDRGLVCRNCGATNAANAAYCASCGSALGDPEQQLIDVSTGEPHVVGSGQQAASGWQGWGSERVEMGRVYVSRGGRRGCLLLNVIFVLLACCTCWVLWNALGSVF
jgi:hypothetical protein